MIVRIIIVMCLFATSPGLNAQTHPNSDELFKQARTAAFEDKDNGRAKQLAKQALLQSPMYAEVQVFLGRLYAWDKAYDSALFHYEQVLAYVPYNEEASVAYTDLEYWNNHYDKALAVCNSGLAQNSASTQLMMRKAKILNALKHYAEAIVVVSQLLKINKYDPEAMALDIALKNALVVNKIGISYEYSHFDKQFKQPWHLVTAGYSRNTKFGSFSTKLNFANYFGRKGWQGELEAYPHLSKIFYGYVSVAYSPGITVFPKYRAGFSLYANLPKSYEVEAGIRYLNFGNETYVYTFYLGKYYPKFSVGLRNYLTPGSSGASQSYSFLTKYNLNGADNFLTFMIGSGVSPDDRNTTLQYSNKNRYKTKQASFAINHSIAKMNIILLKAGWINQEDQINQTGNQVTLSLGYQRRF